tara:strand:- start:5369 stop:5644 length:276 start_codon:yes stop_codon:yes gene_type:complete
MNKLLLFFITISLISCGKSPQLEKCADSMFILTNELMAQRLPGEAQPEAAIKEFLSQSYDIKKDYDYYNALIKICENEESKNPEKFKEDYK